MDFFFQREMDFSYKLDVYLLHLGDLEKSESLRDLIASIKDEIETLKLELRFLIPFFKFISLVEIFDGFLADSKSGIMAAGSRLVSLSQGHMDEIQAAMKNVVCNLLKKIKRSWSIIANCCKLASTSSFISYSGIPYIVVEFIDDLGKNFGDLLIFKAYHRRLPYSVKVQVEVLQGKLRFLKNFLVYAVDRLVYAEKMDHLSDHIQELALEAASLFYSLLAEKMSQKPTVDMDSKFSALLMKIMPINWDVRHLYIEVLKDSTSSKSSKLSAVECGSAIGLFLGYMSCMFSNLLMKILPTKRDVRQIYIHVLKDSTSSKSLEVSPVEYGSVIGLFLGSLLDILTELLNQKASYTTEFRFHWTTFKDKYVTSLMNHMAMLQFELKFLMIFLTDCPEDCTDQGENWDDLQRSIEAITRESGPVIFSLFANQMNEGISRKMILKLSDLQDKIKLTKGKIIQRFCTYKLPKNGEFRSIKSVLDKIKELLCSQDSSMVMLNLHFEAVGRELESLESDMGTQSSECEEMSDLRTRMVDVACWAWYTIDSFVIKDHSRWYCSIWLSYVLEEINRIKADLKDINRKKVDDTELVVGFIPETEKLIGRLTRGTKHQDIVSIIGMSGLGKTTLAQKLFHHPSVTYVFHICIWCYVSPAYQKRELLLDILRQLVDPKNIGEKSDNEDLAKMVYQNLKRKRYLIVLDDIWNIEAWNDMRLSFPDDNNGSRVMFTTQLLDVGKADKDPHSLRSFNDDESWDLFHKIVFKQESCSSELEQIGKKIAKSCGGVPLAVALIAGLLVNTDKKEDWQQVEKNLSSQVVDDGKALCTKIAGLSYQHLPNHLKSCFLYYGAFIGDPEVPVQKLIWLWIAEGFLRKSKKKNLEEAAEDYLNALISRSLVKITKFKSKGGVKACRVHDLVRDFCSAKAEEENLLQLVRLPSSDKFIDYGANPTPTTYEHRRVCVYSSREYFTWLRPSGPRARSLLFFALSDRYSVFAYDASFIFKRFKLLRVLDIGSLNVGDFPTGLKLLVRLRYLAMRVAINTIPPSLADLCNLETIIIKGSRGEIVLPDIIWKMANLRHLHIDDRASFGSKCQDEGNHEKAHHLLDNLETISTPCLKYGGHTENILKRIPNVRKMRCIFLDSWGTTENSRVERTCNRFPKMEILSHLESLKIFYHGRMLLHPCEFSFPSNLKKLTLSNFRLPWNEISTIGKLLNLEVLKLLFRAFEGPRWEMIDGEFDNLKYLELENLDISVWDESDDPFPNLRRLILRSCKQLKEVPSSFGDIRMLERIEVHWCSRSAADSAIKIREDQKDLGNEEIHVSILPQDWDVKPDSGEIDN